jgi:hypothetical protein
MKVFSRVLVVVAVLATLSDRFDQPSVGAAAAASVTRRASVVPRIQK